jgi:hypothetical protein
MGLGFPVFELARSQSLIVYLSYKSPRPVLGIWPTRFLKAVILYVLLAEAILGAS